jgi:hypothetical protein
MMATNMTLTIQTTTITTAITATDITIGTIAVVGMRMRMQYTNSGHSGIGGVGVIIGTDIIGVIIGSLSL